MFLGKESQTFFAFSLNSGTILLVFSGRSIWICFIVDITKLIYEFDIINKPLLMSEEEGMDSDLQRSLDDLDQEFNEEQSQNQNSQGGQGSQDHEDDDEDEKGKKKGKKDEIKNHLREKKSALDQLMPPDEDVDSIPPYVVVVHGSKSSGKSSIIRSLVKHYTKHKIDEINGTITLRSTKKQRVTIIQCPNDVRAMIDLSKIADIVLLLIDASLGFEMETFQFLSLLKCHGFPHVMGALTHLDFYKENKQLRKAKKKFKKRFQYEVGGNNKLFNLSKWDNGLYPKIQTSKIARYIGTSSPPNVVWRLNHPYVLSDRWQLSQDKNYQPNDEVDVDFYGYIRGASYRMNGRMHFVGLGDFNIKEVEVISDPCPEYKKQQTQEKKQDENQQEQNQEQSQDESDNQNQPKNQAVAVQAPKKKRRRRTLAQNQRIIYAPSCNLGTLSFEHTSGYVTIPHEYIKFTRRQNPEDGEQEEIQEGVEMVRNLQDMRQTINEKLRKRDRDFELFEGVDMVQEQNQEQNNNDASDFQRKKKQMESMKQKTQNLLIPHDEADRLNRHQNLSYLIYESKDTMMTYDCSKFHPEPQPIEPESFKALFTTGMDGDVLNQMSDQNESEEEEKKKKKIQKLMKQNIKKVKINENNNFFQKGHYVKIVLEKVKYSDFKQITTKMPVILSRINLGQDNLGFVKVNFKRHRWYPNLLKSNDPIIVSSGWRRYQTLITFAKTDPNDRMRFLKYTPHYDFCVGVFYGNFNQQNSGCIFTQTIKNDVKKFRIAGSGLITQINKSFQIMKKIKLIGQPYKILKNTAFIRGMFNSTLEVANYIGAQIRTVSGIRGQIKKGTKEGGQGTFRATFQDKILMSDIVFCRAWYRVVLDRFYNPVLSFGKNRLMKTKYQLRIQKGVDVQLNPDSQYKNVDRAPQTFKPMVVPKKLQGKLPFKTLQKVKQSKKDKIKRKQNQGIPKILMSDKDREVASLIQRLNTIKNEKQAVKDEKWKQKQRIRSAMERPREEYYQSLKKQQKSEKMAALMRKKNKEDRSQGKERRNSRGK